MTRTGEVEGDRAVGHAAAGRLRPRPLIGRESEIADVSADVLSCPVTTVTGPGGVGKTVLAMAVASAVADDFPSGVWPVWLASLRSPELAAAEVAASVGLPRSRGSAELRGESVDVHLVVLVLGLRADDSLDDLTHRIDRFALPNADAEAVIVGGCVDRQRDVLGKPGLDRLGLGVLETLRVVDRWMTVTNMGHVPSLRGLAMCRPEKRGVRCGPSPFVRNEQLWLRTKGSATSPSPSRSRWRPVPHGRWTSRSGSGWKVRSSSDRQAPA